ncbi:hypothetical protein OG462_08295 [Streptomyces sp. NBC_01077]|uniref:hypothetical protein n=1 Tax=Streptomyces sp. NBC_01077 TaxID=2903746 RepID=UPI0038652B8D|nr:hypothetical protein OG462_08295 [Streptomyces sp. NBC_01077]
MSDLRRQAATAGAGRPDGRELSPGIVVLSAVVGGISLTIGALLAVASLFGYTAGAWVSPEALSPGLIGAAMAGVAPALFTIGRARVWEDVRSLVLPLVIVLVGLFAVSVLNGGSLQAAKGGPLFLALFSLGWVATLGLLALGAVGCLAAQYRGRAGRASGAPAGPAGSASPGRAGGVAAGPAGAARRQPVAPMPDWSKPPLAVVGSGWFGIGAGLLAFPDFWGALVPWTVNRADAQGLGVWALALGVGVLGALAEDDLTRIRPALRAVPAVALALGALLAVHSRDVDWASGPGVSLIALVTGLLVTGLSGHWLLARTTRASGADADAERNEPPAPAGAKAHPGDDA